MDDVNRSGYLFSNHDLLILILPLVIEQLLAIAVGAADTIMIATVGESAVSAVSLVDSVNILLINIFAALATGGAVVCGQLLGKRQLKRACIAADQLILFTTGTSVIITALLYIFKNQILTVLFGQIEPDVMNRANTYLMITGASIPFIALYNSGAALFRTMGNSKISMLTSLIMNGINIVGNAILIYGLHFDVEGAAIPTLVSRMIAAVVIYILIRNQSASVHVSTLPVLKPNFRFIKKILNIGIPNGLENSMFQLGKLLVLSLVSTFGTASIAANAVGNNIAVFQSLFGIATNLAITTVASRCVGAGDYKQVRFYTRKLLTIAIGFMLLVNAAIFFLLPLILRLYSLSPEAYEYARKILILHGSMCVFVWPLSFCIPNTLRAANDVKFTMIVAIASMWIFRIGFSYLLGGYLRLGIFGVWIAMIIDWVVRAILFVARYRGHKWEAHEI